MTNFDDVLKAGRDYRDSEGTMKAEVRIALSGFVPNGDLTEQQAALLDGARDLIDGGTGMSLLNAVRLFEAGAA